MSMDVFLGVLSGLGKAQEKKHANLLQQEMQRRQAYNSMFEKMLGSPDILPQTREILAKKLLTLAELPYDKKPPKELLTLDDVFTIQPPMGSEGWQGGQTQRDVQASPMPIPTALEQPGQQQMPGLGEIGQGAVPEIPIRPDFGGKGPNAVMPGAQPQIRQTPPQETYRVPAPAPPPGYSRSGFYTEDEKRQQRIGDLRAQLELQSEFAGRTAEAQAAATARHRAPERPVTPPDIYASSPLGIFNKFSGELVHPAPPDAATDRRTPDRKNYEDYVKETVEAGGKYMSYDAWLTHDANRKRAITYIGGLPSATQTRAQILATQFDNSPVVKQYNEAALRLADVNQLLAGKWSGPSDMAIIYEFMRALDPTSVVRETEYATASKTGNIFQGWAARFNGQLRPEGGFLSAQIKKDFQSVLQARIGQATRQINGIYKDFGRRIDNIVGQPGAGAGFLTNYPEVFKIDVGPQTAQPNAPPDTVRQTPDQAPAGGKEFSVTFGKEKFTFTTQRELDAFKRDAAAAGLK